MSEQVGKKRPAKGTRHARQRGQSLVETAVVFPILILFLAAIVDFGRAFDAYIILTNAAREGARWGSVNPELTVVQVEQIVIDDVLGSGTNVTQWTEFDGDNVTVFGQTEGLDFVRVTVTYDFGLWFGRLIGVSQVTLTKVAEMPRWRD